MLESWLEERTPPPHGLIRLRQRLSARQANRQRRRWVLGLAATMLLLAALLSPRLLRRSEPSIDLDPQGLLKVATTTEPRLAAGACYKLAESSRMVYYQVVALPNQGTSDQAP